MMKPTKKTQLQKAGWRIGDAADFLQLSPEETMIIEIKLALSRNLRERRAKLMTQLPDVYTHTMHRRRRGLSENRCIQNYR